MSFRKQGERGGKRLVRGVLRLLFRKAGPRPPTPDPASVSRVCVIRGDNRLGNLLLLTPLLEAARTTFPKARVDVLVSADAYPDVYRHHPAIDDVVTAPKKAMARNPLRTIGFAKLLRARGYDVAIDASHMHEFSLTTAWAARLTRAPVRIGYDRGDADRFVNVLVPPADDGTHECEVHMRLLRAVVSNGSLPAARTLRPTYTPTDDERAWALDKWREWGLERAVGIFVGARGAKKWPVQRFVDAAKTLVASGTQCVLFGGPVERDVLGALPSIEGVRVAPLLAVRPFAALLQKCEVVVSADTGPMHLAVAVGRPTVEIFTNSDPSRYGYAHLSNHRVVGRPGEEVTVNDVVSALQELR